MAKSIGKCKCAVAGCESVADIREMKGRERGAAGRLYLYCPDCGTVRSTGQRLQQYIAENGQFTNGEKIEKPPKEPEKPTQEPEKKPDIWEGFL